MTLVKLSLRDDVYAPMTMHAKRDEVAMGVVPLIAWHTFPKAVYVVCAESICATALAALHAIASLYQTLQAALSEVALCANLVKTRSVGILGLCRTHLCNASDALAFVASTLDTAPENERCSAVGTLKYGSYLHVTSVTQRMGA